MARSQEGEGGERKGWWGEEEFLVSLVTHWYHGNHGREKPLKTICCMCINMYEHAYCMRLTGHAHTGGALSHLKWTPVYMRCTLCGCSAIQFLNWNLYVARKLHFHGVLHLSTHIFPAHSGLRCNIMQRWTDSTLGRLNYYTSLCNMLILQNE